jgi:hypothetical protein
VLPNRRWITTISEGFKSFKNLVFGQGTVSCSPVPPSTDPNVPPRP